MIIDQLPALATAGDNDEIAIEVGTTTYKIKKSDFLKEFMPKSGGEFTGSVTVGGVLDVTQRRCYANLSSAGWYRALNVTGGFGGGVRSFAVDINITRSYDSTNNEAHCVKLLCVYNGNSIFTNEVSKSNALIIDKIRYNNDSDGNGFLDIHYAGSVTNETSVDFTVHVNPQSQDRFTVRPLDPVADSPSGETVLTTYVFAANTRELLNTNIFRIRKTYSNITINYNNEYILLDSFANMGIPSQNYYLGFNIVGWSGFPTYGFQIIRGSNGTDFYFASSVAGTFYSFTVEYWFADLSV